MKLSITKSDFENLDFQAKCGELSKNRHDYVYNLVEKDGEWYVDFGDGVEELVEFERTIGDVIDSPKHYCEACDHYGGYCGNCDGSHWFLR